jgi:hypothetical protein
LSKEIDSYLVSKRDISTQNRNLISPLNEF